MTEQRLSPSSENGNPAQNPEGVMATVCRLDDQKGADCGCSMKRMTSQIGQIPVVFLALAGMAFAGTQMWQQRESVGELLGLSSPAMKSGCSGAQSNCLAKSGCCASKMAAAGGCGTAQQSALAAAEEDQEPVSASTPANAIPADAVVEAPTRAAE